MLIDTAIKRAQKSTCHHKVSAIALGRKGEIIGTSFNAPRFTRYGGGLHAEMRVMKKWKGIKTIIICRIGGAGDLKPIGPCRACASKAADLGIKICSIAEYVDE